MNILGISCFYHDSAAVVIIDGELVSAAQEERFNRDKYSEVFPLNAINFCLQEANLTIYDIDYIGFYEKPFLKFSRFIINHIKSYPFSFGNFLDNTPKWLEDRLIIPLKVQSDLGYKGETLFIKHHLSHAASAFLVSPFEEAAILTVDGVGEWATATFGFGEDRSINVLKELQYPNSIGLLYAIVTTYLGFNVFEGEGKVMGLAAYGKPVFMDKFKKIILIKEDGSFRLNEKFFSFNKGSRMFNNNFVKLMGEPRHYSEEISERHCDIAATLQNITENLLVSMVNNLYIKTKKKNLCLAGGVFLNCVANSKIKERAPFEKIFIQPAAGDNGGALGAAYYIYNCLLNNKRRFTISHLHWGPSFTNDYVKKMLSSRNILFMEFDNDALIKFTAQRLSENNIVGWFQGRMEFGPRALGNRSILANPCITDIKSLLNCKVKKREEFRPYAPAALEERAGEFFDIDSPSPFMLFAPKVKEEKKKIIPGVTHTDGTARLQTVSRSTNPRFWELIRVFGDITGVPVIINTSFNLSGEPIVCTPEEALKSFQRSEMDYLILENCVIENKK